MNGYTIRKASFNDIPELKRLEKTWEDHEIVSGKKTEDDYFEKCLLEGDLPPIPNRSFNNYELYIIEYKEKMIGFFDLYLGYPTIKSAWISIFVIDKTIRGKGHGKNVIHFVEETVLKQGLKDISIAVDLKNYSGLKFWTKIGFKEVLGVYGDNDYGINKYAVIGLRKILEGENNDR